MRYARHATLVAIGGVIFPFVFGVWLTVTFGYADGFLEPNALFIGAVLTATSIGITVRVLDDLGNLGSSEGVTILGAAVLDDVIGILFLTLIVAVHQTGDFSSVSLGFIALKTFGFWLGLTSIGILISKRISNVLGNFHSSGSALALALALAFAAAGLAESFGLAMIIGAYSIGLALSGTPLAHRLEEQIMSVYHALVPVFFVVMGMMVDVAAMSGVLIFGAIITALAIIGKVIGCGLPAMVTGFNRIGSWRLGLGMLPRGEVALIMAGIGLSKGILGADLFGVAIMMTVVTTLLAPLLLVPSFRNPSSGRRGLPPP